MPENFQYKMNDILKSIIKEQKTCYFVSPHLDDAAFSAGGLISYLSKKTKVVVITAFTEAGKEKHSLSAMSYVKQCGYKIEELREFFTARRKEDRELFSKFGVEVKHLGFLDALWRPKKKLNLIDKFLNLFLADFRYIYPTHKLHISKGRIHKNDQINLKKLEEKLMKTVKDESEAQIFCPVGLGKHVDHIMVRAACTNIFQDVIYWEDSPYNLYHDFKESFIDKNGLKKTVFKKNQATRKGMYPAYKTQFGKLFNGDDFSLPPESYYVRERENEGTKNPISMSTMFFASAIAPVLGPLFRKPKVVFPKRIGSFKYKRRFYPDILNSYALAIYSDSLGRKAIAKLWNGTAKDFLYYMLKNELKILKILSRVHERINDSLPSYYVNVHMPALFGDVETKNSLIILKEFVKGVSASSLGSTEKFSVYLKSNEFLQYLGENLTEEEKKNISYRSALDIVILYPALLLKALFVNYKASWNLISGIPLFLKSVPIFLKRKSQLFGDRDLTLNNILVSEESIYLIDVQFGMFSEPLYDAIYRLCAQWDEENFRLLLLEHVKSFSEKRGENFETLIRGLMVHVATHSLTANDLSKQITKRNFAFLNLAKKGNLKFTYE